MPGTYSMDKGEGVSPIAAQKQWIWIRSGVRMLLVAAFCSLLAACASSSGGKVKVVDKTAFLNMVAARRRLTCVD